MKLAQVNTGLLIATAAVCAYIIVAPIAPMVAFWVAAHASNQAQRLASDLRVPTGQVRIGPNDNRLIIPAMLLNTQINEGNDMSALRTGPWRRPNGSTPDQGGNTVIAGHRFTYTNPRGTFYYLNKMHVGDEIGVFWHGKRYVYRVVKTETVAPNDTAVEAPTADAQLTLYTCTPLWLPKDRLVVVANLEHTS